MSSQNNNRIGLPLLITIIVSSVIGGGVFDLPRDMAMHSSLLGILIGWGVTTVGMLCVVLVFKNLTFRKQELKGGIYTYAKNLLGKYVAFNSAWGYWVSAFVANVAYLVLIFGTLSYFFPAFGDGNNFYSLIGSSILIWTIHFIALKGVKEAAIINIITTIARLLPLILFLIFILLVFNINSFDLKLSSGNQNLGSLFHQVKSTMMVTVWIFLGIEGAVVISTRAKKMKDVGIATVISFFITVAFYFLISVITVSVIPRETLIQMPAPSVAYAFEYIAGPWGAQIVNIGLMIALFGAALGWCILASEMPYVAAKDGVMPEFFAKENKCKAPALSLWMTNGAVQLFLLVSFFSEGTYQLLFKIASITILPPYLLSTLYGLKVSIMRDSYKKNERAFLDVIIASIASLYGIWLIYAAGFHLLVICSVLYCIGAFFYGYSRLERNKSICANKFEFALMFIIGAATIYGVIVLI